MCPQLFAVGVEVGLFYGPRRPHRSPRATDPEIVARLCEARRRHPTWSARKLLKVLRRDHPALAWPARSTGCALLKAQGLVRERRRRRRTRVPAVPLAAMTRPNEVWTTDFKGEFRTGDGAYCYPLTLRDGWSRFVLRCDALTTKRAERRGASRLYANVRLHADLLCQRAQQRCVEAIQALERVLVAHDTVEFDKHGRYEPDDAGPLRSSESRGYLVHHGVVLDPQNDARVGVLYMLAKSMMGG